MNLIAIYQRSPRIVVAEDDQLNRVLLDDLLTLSGCQVRALPDGQAALEAILEFPPDLVLADIDMPRMNGVLLCARVRENPATSTLPVIIITAHDTEAMQRRALEAGANAFIAKPYSVEDLLIGIERLLRRFPSNGTGGV